MQLTEKQREIINVLVGEMMRANSAVPYDKQNYNACEAGINAYLKSLLGEELYAVCDRMRYGFNWGGDRTYADDVQAAIGHALDDIAWEQRIEHRKTMYSLLEQQPATLQEIMTAMKLSRRAAWDIVREELEIASLVDSYNEEGEAVYEVNHG